MRFGDRITDVRESQGAGLGLSIVRSIATAHHGDVRAVARPEGGLTVTLVVPTD
jgi:signal transduction histidine kinase